MFGAIPIPPPPLLHCARCLWPYGVTFPTAPCLAACAVRCQLAAVLVLLLPCRRLAPAPAGRSRDLLCLLRRAWLSAKVAGKVVKVDGIVARLRAKVAGIVAVKVAGVCAKVARFTPKS